MADAPMLLGAVHDTVADSTPDIAVTPGGAPGSSDGVAVPIAVEASEVPSGLVAVTVNV